MICNDCGGVLPDIQLKRPGRNDYGGHKAMCPRVRVPFSRPVHTNRNELQPSQLDRIETLLRELLAKMA